MEEWKEYKLGDIVEANTSLYSSKDKWEKALYLDTGNITENRIENIQEFDCQFLPSRAKRKVKHEDIIFSTVRPNQRHYGFITNPAHNLLVSTGFAVLSVKKEFANPKFVYYWLCRNEIIEHLQNIAEQSVSAYPSIKASNICDLEIELPSLKNQIRIACILSSLDDKIELNRRINENLEQQAQALFKSWFVDNANIELNYYELGNITSITAGGDKPSVYSKELTEKCYIPIYSNGIENEGLYGYTDFAKINNPSITISARGTIGYICLRTRPYVPIVRLISVIPNKEELSAEYLYLWALTQNFSATGTTQQQLTVPNLKKLPIGVPTKEKLKKFNSIVIPIFQLIEKNKDENMKLTHIRDTLLPKLMSGELKLSEIETEESSTWKD